MKILEIQSVGTQPTPDWKGSTPQVRGRQHFVHQNAPQIDGTRSKGGPGALEGPSRNRAQISSNFGRFRPPPGGVPRGALGSCLAVQRRNGVGLRVYHHLRALTALRCYYASGRVPAPSYGLLLLRSCVVVSSNGVQGGSLPFAGASGRPSPRL